MNRILLFLIPLCFVLLCIEGQYNGEIDKLLVSQQLVLDDLLDNDLADNFSDLDNDPNKYVLAHDFRLGLLITQASIFVQSSKLTPD